MDLEIAIKGIVGYVYVSGEPTKEFSRMVRIRRRTDEGVLLGWVMFVYFPLSRRSLLSRSLYDKILECLYKLDSACFCR